MTEGVIAGTERPTDAEADSAEAGLAEASGPVQAADEASGDASCEADAATDEEAADDGRHHLPQWAQWLIAIACGLAIAFFIRTFVFEVYIVPSGSMLETIQEGDRLIGDKAGLNFSAVQAGDIITFDDPDQPGTTLIKRVIATGGQTVDLQDGVVYVDGKPLDEDSYTLGKPSYPLSQYSATALSGPVTYPYTVPDGCVWVMGDNRTNSLDSRYFGAVSLDKVSSRASFIFWPPADARGL